MAEYTRGNVRDGLVASSRFAGFKRVATMIGRLYSSARSRYVPSFFGFNGGWN